VKSPLVAFVSGLLFSVGLAISGMVRPAKIIAFLDFGGAWDPSLAIVMAVGVAVVIIAYRVARRVPVQTSRIDRPLVVGAVLFGLGWGAAGYCPGPAVLAFVTGQRNALWFFPSMIVGMAIYRAIAARYTDETGVAAPDSASA
jgi:uncharacterized membrane protein YedE/YeeE